MGTPQIQVLHLNALAWCIAVLCTVAMPLHAATITVTTNNDSGPGSLRQAIAIANDGDTIAFGVTGNIVLTSGELLVGKSITIAGPGPANLAVDGNANSRVFHIASGQNVSITGLTITNGFVSGQRPDGYGGGIYNDHATLILGNCVISSNEAAFGGGVYNDGFQGAATLQISDSTIGDNTATFDGGGIYNNASVSGNASLTISSSTLSDNSARSGGALYNNGVDYGDALITVGNSAFNGNSAVSGGCIYNNSFAGSASLALRESTFTGNAAEDAGGCIYNDVTKGYGTQTVNNSSLSGNSAGNRGGSIYSSHGQSFSLNNCALSDNSAQNRGGGIYNDGSQKGAAWLTISSSAVNGNSASSGGGIYNDAEQGGDTHLQISNSTISENAASYGGGIASNGYYGFYVSVQIRNSTFSVNSATQVGGSIYNVGQNGQTVTVSLINTILRSGAGGNIFNNFGTILSLGYNLSDDDCGGFLTGPGDQVNTDPMLGPLQDNGGPTLTHALLPGNPAINAGDPNFTPPPLYDQRGPGFDRVASSRIDIGAFEAQGATATPTPTPNPRHTPGSRPRPTPHTRPSPR